MSDQGPQGLKLWLDDLRPAPEGWVWAKTVEEAIEVLEAGEVGEASLDYDMGLGKRNGDALCLWMAENEVWPQTLTVHSSNPPGARSMCRLIERHGPYRLAFADLLGW
jgi:hypothetical protein